MIPNNYLRIKDLAEEDRPREKLLAKGISSLSDAELIAILIGSGNRNESAVDLGKKILGSVSHNLNELGKLSIYDLMKMKGIGHAKAITILSALELGRRRKSSKTITKKKISSSRDVLDYFQPLLADLHYEEFWVLLLNRSNRVVNKIKISQGGISGTVIDVRLILKKAIEHETSFIILCHNHPSGNLEPSESDKKITQKLKEAGKVMDIGVVDHLIISDNSYFSFADEGLLT
ncbi:MAG: DNA repair protein RadC [Bacteroidales bacterium]|nr:DNA repair protein RadC [Bacteroidales bacterium]